MKPISEMDALEFCRYQNETWFPPFPWALDFCRAMSNRPRWARWMFRLVAGKYAYREFIGLQNALMGVSYNPYWDWAAVGPGCSYYDDPVPARWWQERPFEPVK